MFVAKRMKRNVVTVSPSDSLLAAREKIRGHNIHQLPVVSADGKLVGILSNRDIREAVLPAALIPGSGARTAEEVLRDTKVESVMTRKVVTATLDDTMEDAMVLLHDFRVNALPVVDENGRVAGIITRTDALKAFLDALGVGEISSRLEVVVPDKPGALARVVEVIKSFNVNITSVLTTGLAEKGKRAIFFRVATINVGPIKEAIRRAGFPVLEPKDFRP